MPQRICCNLQLVSIAEKGTYQQHRQMRGDKPFGKLFEKTDKFHFWGNQIDLMMTIILVAC